MDILRTRLVAWAWTGPKGTDDTPFHILWPTPMTGMATGTGHWRTAPRSIGIPASTCRTRPGYHRIPPVRWVASSVSGNAGTPGSTPRPAIYGGWHPSHRDTATRPDGRGRRPCPKRMPRNGGRSSTGFECRRGFMARPPTTTQAGLDGRRKRAEGRFDRLRGEEVRGGAAKLRHRGFGQQNLLLHPAAMGGEQPLAL